MAAAVQQLKPIIIHVWKGRSSSSSPESDFGMDGYDFAKVVQSTDCPSSGPDQGTPRLGNAWFILEPTSTDSFKISEIVGGGGGAGGGQSEFRTTASCLVDAAPPLVYAIGSVETRGIRGGDEGVQEKVQIRVQKLNEKWRFCNKLNIGLLDVRAAVPCKQFIYIFGPFFDYSDRSKVRFGYVYDTIKHKGYMIDAPLRFNDNPITHVWAPVEEDGVMLVCFDDGFYIHSPTQNIWSRCPYLSPLPSVSGPSSVLDGVLYICDNVRDQLYACKLNCDECKLLYSVMLPKLRINGFLGDCFFPVQLVAVSETWMCIFGTTMGCLFCAHVEVCFDGARPYAKLSQVQCFQKDGIQEVYSCLALSQGMQATMSVLSSLLDQ